AEANVTEPGEQSIVSLLHHRYQKYIEFIPIDVQTYLTVNALTYDSLKASCIDLFNINKKGMDIRNSRAKEISNEAALYTIILAGVILLIAVLTLFGLPALVINPITELTTKIKAIA